MTDNNDKKKFHYKEIDEIIYVKTESKDFNIETYRKAKVYFDAKNPLKPKLLRLLNETEDLPKLLAVGNEPNDKLHALKGIKWEQQIEL